MQIYKEIFIENISQEKIDILIALLQEIDYYAFEEGDNFLKAFIKKEDFKQEAIKTLAAARSFTFTQKDEEEKNWNALWESNFPEVIVDDFVAVRAAFHSPVKNTEHEIIITPKMSFGTGHHATTFMMLQQMKTLNFAEKSVFDFGTGTGVLAILAEKLGATKIYAVDNDDWSIENAKENFAKNNCQNIIIDKRNDALSGQKFDIILANINKNVLLQNMATLSQQLAENGTLIISGLLSEDENDIVSAAEKYGLKKTAIKNKLQWILLQFTKK